MAQVVITIKVMPSGINVNLNNLKKKVKEKIEKFGGEIGNVEEEPIAFGLKALKIIFILDEKKGGTDKLEESINTLKDVNSVEVTDVRRAIG